jgi:hypothetical protein
LKDLSDEVLSALDKGMDRPAGTQVKVRDLVAWCDHSKFVEIDGIDMDAEELIHLCIDEYCDKNPNPSGIVVSEVWWSKSNDPRPHA